MLDEKYIAKRIRELCDKKHMSMYALSQKTSISQSSLSNLMKRGSIPTIFTLDRICEGLGITLAQFFAGSDERPDLTEEQERVLEIWDSLSDREKQAVETYVRGIRLE